MISSIKNKSINFGLIVRIISAIIIAVSAIVIIFTLIKTGAAFTDVLKIIILIIIYAVLPGYIAARRIAERKSSSQIISFCMVFSAAFLILFYYLDELVLCRFFPGIVSFISSSIPYLGSNAAVISLKGMALGIVGCPILSLISIILIIHDLIRKKVRFSYFIPDIRVAAIMAAAMVIAFFSLYMRMSVPVNKIGSTSFYYDVAWLIGNDASVAKGWPTDTLQFLGKYLNSNIFANVFRASLSRASGVSSAVLFGIYGTFIAVPNCVFAVAAVAERWFKNTEKAAFATFLYVFATFFSVAFVHFFNVQAAIDSAKSSYFASAMVNVLTSPNGIDLAIPAVCVLVILILDYYQAEKIRFDHLLALFFIGALCTGAKFVFTVCVLGAIAGTVILRLFQGKGFKGLLRMGIMFVGLAVIFAVVYLGIVRGGEIYESYNDIHPIVRMDNSQDPENERFYEENAPDRAVYRYEGQYSSLQLGASIQNSKLLANFRAIFRFDKERDNILCFFLIPIHFILQMFIVSIPYVVWMFSKLKRFKQISREEMLIAGISVCGLLVYYLLNVNGNSQVYFFFCASIFINTIGAGWLYDNFKQIRLIGKLVFVACLMIAIFSTAAVTAEEWVPGLRNLKKTIVGNQSVSIVDYDTINEYEHEAMLWLRENTEPDAVIAVDRHYRQELKPGEIPEPNQGASRYYYYTAYSERQTYLGSWAYMPRTAETQKLIEERLVINDALFKKCSNRKEIMEHIGISYLVQSRFVNTALLLDNDLKMVFHNRDITIYALR